MAELVLFLADDNTAFNDFCVERGVSAEDIYRMSEEALDKLIEDFHNRNNHDPDGGEG